MVNSIFQQAWWLDAVAPGEWKAVEILRQGELVARWPYVMEKRIGFTYISQPPLTQTLGPWIKPGQGKYANILGEQKELITEMAAQLPPFSQFSQNFHYSITNWLPLYWLGFQQTTKYTYVLDDLGDLEKIWSGVLPNIRTDIKKAVNRFGLHICNDLGIEKFLDINELTFKRQGKALPYSRAFVRRLDKACEQHHARKMFFAVDNENQVHAAVYIIWDEQSAYNIMIGGDPKLRNSGATSLCMWEAIRFAATVTKRFDFEGSMIEPIERFYRAFGARQVPYFSISKTNATGLVLRQVAGLLKRSLFKK